MNLVASQVDERLFAPDTTRPCLTCKHRSALKLGVMMGPRCLHPMAQTTDLILGLPQMCSDVRHSPISACGPAGHLHSSAPSATSKAS